MEIRGPPARGRVIFPTAPGAVRAGDAAPQSDYYPMSLSPSRSSGKVARGLRAELLFPFSLSSDPLLPSCHHSAPPPHPTPAPRFLVERRAPDVLEAGPRNSPCGWTFAFVFLFTHERVHRGLGGRCAALWEELFAPENHSLSRPGPDRDLRARRRHRAVCAASPRCPAAKASFKSHARAASPRPWWPRPLTYTFLRPGASASASL